ncbi:GTP-binding protein A [Rhypophila decipiens]|uniref:GTP-binding protein A n=1 Tax=Rhypophila decipiens TaxID=261697 RepID=A0AAN6YCL7_9PEZI|nr:GTP-binding protein A [Rhypophila decipiens]
MGRSKPRPIMVLIVGLTGAGKTTFTRLASGRKDLKVGDGIDPCTQDPVAVRFDLDGRPVVLIDTPGFDDISRTDVEILEDIAKWLVKQGFSKRQPLDGMILLYPILFDFDSSLEKRRTRILQKILGKNAYRRVVVATTMWGSLINEKEVEQDIDMRWKQQGGVWDEFRQGNALLTKHFNTEASAQRILRAVIKASDEAERAKVLIQEELGRKNIRFAETSLGEELECFLQQDITVIHNLLLNHRDERPPEEYRTSNKLKERKEWYRWDAERQELTKNLELRQKQLKRLNSFFFLKFKLLRFWSKLFS